VSVHPTRTGKYEVRYREGTRNRSKTFDRKSDAAGFDTDWKAKRQLGEQIIRPKDTPALDDLFRRFQIKRAADGIAKNTLLFNASVMEKHLSPYLGYLRVAEISPERLDEWQQECPASPYMMNRAVELLGQLMAYAKRLRFVAANYAADLERRPHRVRRGKTASPAQVEAMRDYFIEKDRLGYATLISVSAYVGIRPDETLNLHWEHLHGRRFLIDPDIAKTNVSRYPEIPDPVMADLAQWKLVSGSPVGLIFPRTKDGMPWRKTDRDNWRARWFRPAEEAAGLEGFRPYDLRHTCASLMLRAQVPPADVAAHMGHGLQVLFSTYGHEIEAMRGQPAVPVEQSILEARGSDVRRKFGAA
jgi:integrase